MVPSSDIIQQIMSWVNNPIGCWVSGPAGSGKSTVAHTVTDLLLIRRPLGAYIFCEQGKSNPGLLIRILAYQLARFNPIIAACMVAAIGDVNIASASIEGQFEILFLEYFISMLILLILKFCSTMILLLGVNYLCLSTFKIGMCLVQIHAYPAYSKHLLIFNPSAYSESLVLILCLFTHLKLCYIDNSSPTTSNKHMLISGRFGSK